MAAAPWLLLALQALAPLAAAIGLTLGADRAAQSPVVDVKFLGEAGCPYTRKFILGALNRTLTSKGLAEVLRFDFLPFGNAFFATKECPSTTYSSATRHCFNNHCGPARLAAGVPQPLDCHTSVEGDACFKEVAWAMRTGIVEHPAWYPSLTSNSSFEDFQRFLHGDARLSHVCHEPCAAQVPAREDCFRGTLVCQHGQVECEANRWMACARKGAQVPGDERSRTSYSGYMPFVYCMTAWYDYARVGRKGLDRIAADCAANAGLDWGPLARCYGGPEGDAAITDAAKATPVHMGVPWLYINGESMQEDHEDELFQEVCKALPSSARPQECLEELGKLDLPRFTKASGSAAELMAPATSLRHLST